MKNLPLTLGFIAALALLHACTLEEEFITDSGLELRFSQDTVRFDTVFTEVGSATQSFKIYNPFADPVNISSVRVGSNPGGRFRINVDGRSGDMIEEIFLAPNDSVYVFVEVTVDPDEDVSVSPFVFEGNVIIEATDLEQVVMLEAFGQNANYLPRDRGRSDFGLLTCGFGEIVFDDPKPYVLYGSLVVDECTLTLPPGCRLYVHGGLVMNSELFPENPIFNDGLIIFQGSGRLNIAGTVEQPVLIATDRLEERFLKDGGQYSGIRLGSGTGPHSISHARIRNGIVGVFADSTARIDIDHTEISYTSSTGVVGYQADVTMSNTLVHSNGGGAVLALKGGNYSLDYCTLVNYGSQSPAVLLSNGIELRPGLALVGDLQASLRNTIVYGSLMDELALSDFNQPERFAYSLENCVLKTERVRERRAEFDDRCNPCLFPERTEPLFVSAVQDSFGLDSLSVAEGFAQPLDDIGDDLLGVIRDGERPDCGALEREE